MRRSPARALLVPLVLALTTALSLGVLAAPAEATRRSVTDARRDVLKQVGDQPPVRARQNTSADLVRATTSLGRRALVLTTSVRRLPKNYWAMLWRIRTDADVEYALRLLKTGDVIFELAQAGVPVACEGLRRKVEPRRDRVVVVVPLGCLGSPRSLRAGAGTAATSRDFGRIFTDDAHRRGRSSPDDLALGRPVRRG